MVMLRARVEKTRIARVADASSVGSRSSEGVNDDDEDGRSAISGARRRAGDDGEMAGSTENFAGVVTALLELRPGEVFCAVVGFL